MLCENIHSALLPILARYELDQICYVLDKNCATLPTHSGLIQGENSLLLAVQESHKSLETVQQIWDFLFEHDITRRGLLVAIGGGVLTDMAGFVAATYKRGIDYVNIPTTLLAMIDASSGGKTGFNYHGLKNSIGAFYPPVETLICPEWIQTLPTQEFLSGFAEMLKTGLLNTKLWPQLLQYDLDTMDVAALTPLIEQCVGVKERIVAADPKEEGLRKALNLGHTFGHALEEILMDNSQLAILPHGYAVLYGLIAELYLSVTKLHCAKDPLQQLTQIMLHYYGKPQCKCSDREKLIRLMQQDKKNERAAEINCTLIRSVGSPVLNQTITPEEANEAWEYLFSL
ncbi:MAG: 3-dehydroquinate synthase [Paludibacteraceae bacterium]|nr:3-dehydroquinate synthase [Paludibacteraceae bacterium]